MVNKLATGAMGVTSQGIYLKASLVRKIGVARYGCVGYCELKGRIKCFKRAVLVSPTVQSTGQKG